MKLLRPILALVLLCCLLGVVPARQTTPAHAASTFVGLVANPVVQWWRDPADPQPDSWYGTADIPGQLSLMGQLGVSGFRVEFPWSLIAQDQPGGTTYSSTAARNPNCACYDWERTDHLVQSLAAAGIDVLPQVVYTPAWAAGTQPNYQQAPPTSAAYYADFMTALVARYHSQIHAWELWNEEDNAPHGWVGTAQEYVALILRPGYQAVKAADPTALVVLGGLAGADMNWAYGAGAEPYFDVGSIHDYPGGCGNGALSPVQIVTSAARAAMNAAGDSAKPLWLTEVGIPTADSIPGGATFTTPACQADLVTRLFTQLTGADRVYWYQLSDTNVYDGPPAGAALVKQVFWGLVSRDLATQKPGFAALQAISGGVPVPTNTPAPATATPVASNTPANSATPADTATAAPPTTTPLPTNTPGAATNTPVATASVQRWTLLSIAANPSTVAKGGSVTFVASLTAAQASTGNRVLFELKNSANQLLWSTFVTGVDFAAGPPTVVSAVAPIGTTSPWGWNPVKADVAIYPASGGSIYFGLFAPITVQ